MAPTYVTVYNTTGSAIVVDNQGHTLGGGEWGAVRRSDMLDDLANAGRLVPVTGIDTETASDDPVAAHRQAEAWNTAAAAFEGADLEAIRAAAAELGGWGDLPTDEIDRADAVDMLVRAGVDPPKTKGRKPASSPQE